MFFTSADGGGRRLTRMPPLNSGALAPCPPRLVRAGDCFEARDAVLAM